MSEERKLPKIQDLHHDVLEAFKTDQLNLLLNQPPLVEWVKEHPFAKNVKYIPIDKVEFLLTKIFQEWRVEVMREGQMFNSVYVAVRLHYKNPLNGEWGYHDGLGAVGVQTDAGKSASDLGAIKQDAIMKALPAAESYAVKDAAEKLGKLFGKDLNRKDTIGFSETYEETKPLMDVGMPIYTSAFENILKSTKSITYYEDRFDISEPAKEQLEKCQVITIKALCEQGGMQDEERNEMVRSYMNEEASAEAIVNGLKERFGIKFLNQL